VKETVSVKPKTLILRTAGTNCELELAHAFESAGATCEFIHINALMADPSHLQAYDLLGLPGGFSYGDDIAAGRIMANRIRHGLYPALRQFVAAGKPVIGICNGFQLLVKSGLLPAFELPADAPPRQQVTLADNATPRFMDRWIRLRSEPETQCIWTAGLGEFDLPIAHGEGRFIADDEILDRLESNGMVAMRYQQNPNGSMRDIAGICDPSGRVLGLMPHPERCVHATHLFDFTRRRGDQEPAGLTMFRNAVEAARGAATT
jgi:phosphoribosylformylglycinamidine synthase I